jgi:hypothetical protein
VSEVFSCIVALVHGFHNEGFALRLAMTTDLGRTHGRSLLDDCFSGKTRALRGPDGHGQGNTESDSCPTSIVHRFFSFSDCKTIEPINGHITFV